MIEKDLQFSIKDDNGNDVDCYIFAYKVVSDTEMNVIFKQDNDEDDVIRYGRIIKKDDDYSLDNLNTFISAINLFNEKYSHLISRDFAESKILKTVAEKIVES